MFEYKLISVAEKLHNKALRTALKLSQKRVKRAEKKVAREKAYAERASEAAFRAIAKAGVFYQEAQSRFSKTSLEVNALTNDIENRLDDLGFRKEGE